MNELFAEDFDLIISQVVLAHRYGFGENSVTNMGRNTPGLVYCLSGSARYTWQGGSFQIGAGELILLPEGMYYSISCTEAFYHITVNFCFLPTAFSGRLSCADRLEHMVAQDTFGAEDALQQVVALWNQKPAGFQLQVRGLLYQVLHSYLTALRRQSRTPEYGKLRPAKKLLDSQYSRDIPVEQLASACGFSQTHFRRLFAREFHCSPVEYRMEKRLLRAKDLLLAGELSVSQIAALVGFADANYFSRVFRQRFGISPTGFAQNKELFPS